MIYFTIITTILLALYVGTAIKRIHADVALLRKAEPTAQVSPFNNAVFHIVERVK